VAIVVEGVVGAAAVPVGVPTYWWRKKTTEVSTRRRGR
jgi:hypothetical protein